MEFGLFISGACKPGISPPDDRPRTNCRRMQFSHREGSPCVEGSLGARLSVAARLSVRDEHLLACSPYTNTGKRHILARARACSTYTYIRIYPSPWDVPSRPYERDETYIYTRAGVAPVSFCGCVRHVVRRNVP